MVVEQGRGTGEQFSHQALFYRDDASYLAGTVPFILDGLARREPVAVAVPPVRLRQIDDALGSARDRVRLLDMVEIGRNPGRLIPAVLHAFADEHGGPVRVIGEPVWPGRSEEEYAACVQHEAMVNLSFEGRDATFLCPYDVTTLSDSVVADAEATHSGLVDTAGARPSPAYAPEAAYERYNLPLSAPDDAFSVPFDLETLSKARHVATEFAQRAGFEGDRLHDVALAVGEVCANSVEHGGGAGVLAVWPQRDGIVCEVTDRGQPTDRLAGRKPATAYQAGGRGLLLVNQVADLVRTHVGPEGLTTQIYLRP